MFNTVQITISTSSLQRSLGRRWFKYKCSWTKCSEITEKCDKKLQFLHCTVVMFMFKNHVRILTSFGAGDLGTEVDFLCTMMWVTKVTF